jgi:hypothetical protein
VEGVDCSHLWNPLGSLLWQNEWFFNRCCLSSVFSSILNCNKDFTPLLCKQSTYHLDNELDLFTYSVRLSESLKL